MRIEHPAPEQIPGLRKLWQLAFGDPDEFLDGFFDSGYAPERCLCVSGEEAVTAALYWFDCLCGGRKLAYLYAVATHPDHRGRGVCRSLMARTHELLHQRGYAGALLVPQDAGLRKMYAAMGYRDCTRVAERFYTAAETPVPVRRVGTEEYARLRRSYLPERGILQEGENLRFLASMAELYAGEDFLLAASAQGESLWAMELLGDPKNAGGILKALGYGEGTFRMPGDETAFAMYQPFSPDAPEPAYFALAFD